MLGINPTLDIIPYIDTQYISFASGRLGKSQSVTAFRLKNEEGMSGTLARLFAEGAPVRMRLGDGFSFETFLGAPFYAFNSPGSEEPFAVTVAGGHLFIGQAEGLREVVRTLLGETAPQSSFYDLKTMQELRGIVPVGAFAHSLFDWDALVKAAVTEESSSRFQEVMAASVKMQGAGEDKNPIQQYLAGLDYSRMPSAGHFASFFGPMFSYTEDKNGRLHYRMIMRYPAAGD